MLDNAIKYEAEIREKFLDTWYDTRYQYYFGCPYHAVYKVSDDDDCSRSFVSLNQEKEVIGLLSYDIDREVNRAYRFGAINFTDDAVTFAIDLRKFIDDIFVKFGMNKLEFNVVRGNPAEKHYDKLVEKVGGRILCIRREAAKLLDGTLADDKMYEIMRKDYLRARKKSI